MTTIIYYTANAEKPEFEKKIVDNIKRLAGDIPIISVSQKPMDFGTNICLGDIGHNYFNCFNQALIGAKAATTEYVTFAESDCLYSPDYFAFQPTGGLYYRFDNVWIAWPKHIGFRKKRNCEGMQIVNREYMIQRFEAWLSRWPKSKWHPLAKVDCEWFSGLPCITFKTSGGLSPHTGYNHQIPPAKELPYWGDFNELITKYI